MKKTAISTIVIIAALAAMITSTTSCNKNLFDKQVTDTIKKITFHNDKVDPNHTWSLMNDWVMKVYPNISGVKRIEILSEDPYTSREAEVLGSRNVTENKQTTVRYSVPTVATTVYVAAITEDGDGKEQYTVVSAPVSSSSVVDFTSPIAHSGSILKTPEPMTVYYCYCASYPEPDPNDKGWGYNDLVLKVQKEYVNEMAIRLHVTLQAIGTTKQIAAAIRLNGVKYADLYDITTTTEKNTFIKDPEAEGFIIEDKNLKIEGRDGYAVLKLFDDAHAAFRVKTNNNGTVERWMFNVSHTTSAGSTEWNPVTVSYNVVFNKAIASEIGFWNLDPFIAYYYNTARWEVHKYNYKFCETLFSIYEGRESAYYDGFSWALEIPYSQFRYPLSGNGIGSYKDGVLYGAYQYQGHSFGEWGSDRNKAQDWYLNKYAQSKMVY